MAIQKTSIKITIIVLLFISASLIILYRLHPKIFLAVSRSVFSTLKYPLSPHSTITWQNIGDGIDIYSTQFISNDVAGPVMIFFARFDPEKIQTQVLYENNITTAEKIAKAKGTIAVINASFFDPQNRPLGLLIQNSEIVQRIPQRGMLNSGIFCILKGQPKILHRQDFNHTNLSEAVQSFPRLIHNRRKIELLKDADKRTRRSGIAIDRNGKIIIFITDSNLVGVSLNEMQQILLKPDLKIQSALNLDGGRSSQFYMKYHNFSKQIYGIVEVPVFIGFKTKEGQ